MMNGKITMSLQRQDRQDVGDLDCFFFRGFVRVSHLNLSRCGETIVSVQ